MGVRIITPIVLVALWAALAQASDSSSLKVKLQNRKESEISMEKRVRNISEEARLSILANREKERVHQEDAFFAGWKGCAMIAIIKIGKMRSALAVSPDILNRNFRCSLIFCREKVV